MTPVYPANPFKDPYTPPARLLLGRLLRHTHTPALACLCLGQLPRAHLSRGVLLWLRALKVR